MTKSKKLISMFLAFVMLITSCSLSLFAYAADSAETIAAAEKAAYDAFVDAELSGAGTSDASTLDKNSSTLAEAYLAKVKALEDGKSINPVYYAFALQAATVKVARYGSTSTAFTNRNLKATQFHGLASGNATTKGRYEEFLGTIPAGYLSVISAYDTAIGGDTNSLVLGKDIDTVDFNSTDDAAAFESFMSDYEGFDAKDLLLADSIPNTIGGTGANKTFIFTVPYTIKSMDADYHSDEAADFAPGSYFFGSQQGNRIPRIYYLYLTQTNSNFYPLSADDFDGDLIDNLYVYLETGITKKKEYNANRVSRDFYDKYFTALDTAYPGTKDVLLDIIDLGIELGEGTEVTVADAQAAVDAYDALSEDAKMVVELVSQNVTDAIFNPWVDNENYPVDEDGESTPDADAYVEASKENAQEIIDSIKGDSFIDLLAKLRNITAGAALDEYKTYVDGVLAGAVEDITDAQITETKDKFAALDDNSKEAVRTGDSAEYLGKSATIMFSKFINEVNAASAAILTAEKAVKDDASISDIDAYIASTKAALDFSVEAYKALIGSEDENDKVVRALVNNEDSDKPEYVTNFQNAYSDYRIIQLASFRKSVEGADLDTISTTDVDAVKAKYDGLSAESQNDAQNDTALYAKYLQILVNPFRKDIEDKYSKISTLTDTDRSDAESAYNALTDELKTVVQADSDLYGKYQQILISGFRKFVEEKHSDLGAVTDEDRAKVQDMFNAFSAELQGVIQNDADLYKKYEDLLVSSFKGYVEGDDPDPAEALRRFKELTDEQKEIAVNDTELWDTYSKLQIPAVDPDDHAKEAEKKAEAEVYPTTSEAINDLGTAKAIDNVEDFVIDSVLPFLTDSIQIDDRDDAVNSALSKHYTNAEVGKIYAFYAQLSHTDMAFDIDKDGNPDLNLKDVVPALITKDNLKNLLIEDKYSKAAAKIDAAKVPTTTDEDGNEVTAQAPVRTSLTGDLARMGDDDPRIIYEDANALDGVAAIEFENGDFGFEDGDRDGFIDALLAALRPMEMLLEPGAKILGIFPIGIELFNRVDTKTGEYTLGLYETCVTLLEALGATGFMTDEQYKANFYGTYSAVLSATGSKDAAAAIAADQVLKPLITGCFTLIDETKTITDILALIPRLCDVIESDIPSVVYKNVVADLGLFSGMVEDIKINEIPLGTVVQPGVFPEAVYSLLNSKIGDMINDKDAEKQFTLIRPDIEKLRSLTTVKVNKSAQQNKDYVAVRYIDSDVMFTELMYYIYDNTMDKKNAPDNVEAVKNKLGGIALVGSNLSSLIDKGAEKGKLDTYAAVLDYFHESEEEKNYDATAEAGKAVGDVIANLNNTLNLTTPAAQKVEVKLSKTLFNYTGKIRKPSVKIVIDDKYDSETNALYTVTYSNPKSKKIGTYYVTVNFQGANSVHDVTLEYKIGPKNAAKVKAKALKKGLKLTWKKSGTKAVKGYEIQYSTSKDFSNAKTVVVKGRKKAKKTIKGLESGKKYYVRIRSYSFKKGVKYYSNYSGKKAVKVK